MPHKSSTFIKFIFKAERSSLMSLQTVTVPLEFNVLLVGVVSLCFIIKSVQRTYYLKVGYSGRMVE